MNTTPKPFVWRRDATDYYHSKYPTLYLNACVKKPFVFDLHICIGKNGPRARKWEAELAAYVAEDEPVVLRIVKLPGTKTLEQIEAQFVPQWKSELVDELACNLELWARYVRSIPAS